MTESPGMIAVIHTFGDYARFHPHLHAIVADGLFRPNCAPHAESKELEEIFRAKVLTMLKNEGKINEELIGKLMNWRQSGFIVHVGNRIVADPQWSKSAGGMYPAERLLATGDHLPGGHGQGLLMVDHEPWAE
jgi:hypothetical protein